MSKDTNDFNPEVSRLRRQVRDLIDNARHNEQIHNRFQTIELALLAATDFYVIAEYLQDDFRRISSLDAVSLVLIDSRDEIKNALCPQGLKHCPPGMVLVDDRETMRFLEQLGQAPALSAFDREEYEWLFGDLDFEDGSVAILPFVRRGRTIGCLALFSRDSRRYYPGVAADLLQRLGAVTAICVENCLNYEHLRRQGLTDSLTGLANRRELEKRLAVEVSRALRDTMAISCLYLDVDHFKQVNDVYGHNIGDLALQKVAAVMVEAVRLGDIVARYGGEEFVIVLPGIAGSVALETAERIRQSVEDSSMAIDASKHLEITISIGLASFTPGSNMIADISEITEQLLSRADQALYQAKEQGRNRVVVAE